MNYSTQWLGMGIAQMLQTTPIVFVVDDDISVRESLELLIRHEGLKVETFTSAQEFLTRPRERRTSCLVLDVSLPGLNGLDLQKLMRPERPDVPIVFITGHGDIPMTVQAMKAGAIEFLTKPLRKETLLSAVRNALERSRLVLGREDEMQILKVRYASLTSREREVLELVASGVPNKQIGSELGISVITVKGHRGCMMRKMMADSLAELIGMASRLRVVRWTSPSARVQQ
jgi:FixJ family two-component response regulator